MKNSFAKYMALLMLAIFMTSIGNMSAASFVHDLQHDNDVKHSITVGYMLPHQHLAPAENIAGHDTLDLDNFDISEHQILHALNHLQFFADMSQNEVVVLPFINAAPLQLNRPFLPLANIDLPLRPPQSSLLPA